MNREEKAATRYRAMFRHYPDALTPRQVQEMFGIGQRMAYDLYRVPKSAVIDYLYSEEKT